MKVLFISHKPPYPIVDGGCHAMDRMFEISFYCYPEAVISYVYFATEKHPEIKKKFRQNLKRMLIFSKSNFN